MLELLSNQLNNSTNENCGQFGNEQQLPTITVKGLKVTTTQEKSYARCGSGIAVTRERDKNLFLIISKYCGFVSRYSRKRPQA